MSYVPWTPQRLERQLADMREAAETAHETGRPRVGEPRGVQDALRRDPRRRPHRGAADRRPPPPAGDDDSASHCSGSSTARRTPSSPSAKAASATPRRSPPKPTSCRASLSEDPSGGYGVQLFSIRREQGRLDEARPIVEAIARLGRAGSTWRPALAVMYAELGLHDEAAAEIDVLHADRLAAVPRDALWHGSLSYLADACAAVGHRDGAAARVRGADRMARPRRPGRAPARRQRCRRPVPRQARRAARARPGGGDPLRDGAAASKSAAGMPVWLAHTQLDYGRTMLARGQPRGEGLLRAALATAEQLGMATVAAAARSELGEQPKESTGALLAGLTEREVAVLALVADGRSNREIGAQPAHQPAHRGEPRAVDPDEAAVRQPHGGGGVGVAAEPGDGLSGWRAAPPAATDRRGRSRRRGGCCAVPPR